MYSDSINLVNGAKVFNLAVETSAAFPLLPSNGQVVYLSTGTPGLYFYYNSIWEKVGTAQDIVTHASDFTLHLTTTQNTFLDSISVSATEINFLAGITSSVKSLLDAKVNLSGSTMTGNLVVSTGAKVTLADGPVAGTDAANKNYVDASIAGLSWKNSVSVATTANIALSGTQTIDGIAVVVDDRVLVKNQTTASQNGIYVVAAGAWTRATDMDQTTPINEINSAAVFVRSGTIQADTGWTQVNNVAIIGTDAIAFTQFTGGSSVTAGAGLLLTGNTLSVALGAGIAQLPTNEVGVEVYSTGGLMTTLDGASTSTLTNAKLALKLDGTSLTLGTSGLRLSPTLQDKLNMTVPYDIAGSMLGKPGVGSAIISRFVAVRPITIAAGFPSSIAKAATVATASTVFNLAKNGAGFGTLTFAAGATSGVFASSANVTFAAGDVLTLVAPATLDATFADMEFTLVMGLLTTDPYWSLVSMLVPVEGIAIGGGAWAITDVKGNAVTSYFNGSIAADAPFLGSTRSTESYHTTYGYDGLIITNAAGSLNIPGNFTAEAWIKPEMNTNGLFGGIVLAQVGQWSLGTPAYSGIPSFNVIVGGVSYTSTFPIALPAGWSHLAGVKTATTIQIFVNGIGGPIVTTNGTATTFNTNIAISCAYISTQTGYPQNCWIGYVDELRITKYARYTSNFSIPSEPFPQY